MNRRINEAIVKRGTVEKAIQLTQTTFGSGEWMQTHTHKEVQMFSGKRESIGFFLSFFLLQSTSLWFSICSALNTLQLLSLVQAIAQVFNVYWLVHRDRNFFSYFSLFKEEDYAETSQHETKMFSVSFLSVSMWKVKSS